MITKKVSASGVLIGTMLLAGVACADLQQLQDQDMTEVTGAGLAVLPENLRILFGPNDYIRAVPRGAPVYGKAADMYWYGFAFSGGDGDVTQRYTATKIKQWGTEGNPWTFRAISPSFLNYVGASVAQPVLQYSAPDFLLASDFNDPTVSGGTSAGAMNLKYAFFGDLAVCGGTPTYGSFSACGGQSVNARLLSQNVWDRFSFHGSQYNIFQTVVDYGKYLSTPGSEFLAVSGANQGTFGAVWTNRINSSPSGVYRFTVAQSGTAGLQQTTFPETNSSLAFNTTEGVWIKDMDFNMPVGHLHYQPIIFDNDSSGNMVIEVVRIPNVAAVYNYAYRNYSVADPGPLSPATKMCTNATLDCTNATHGQVWMGNITFKDASGNAANDVDLGSALMDGIFIQHLKIKTLGL